MEIFDRERTQSYGEKETQMQIDKVVKLKCQRLSARDVGGMRRKKSCSWMVLVESIEDKKRDTHRSVIA